MTDATVTIRNTAYTVTPETDPDDDATTPARMLGWLTGPRGATAAIVRLQPSGNIALVAHSGAALARIPNREVNAALQPMFA